MYPKVSILIPTLNASNVLPLCLESIANQDYPKDKIQIVIADGASTDNTLDIAKKYHALIVSNPLKTAEAGKVCALKASDGEFIALIDSDNILPNKSWLSDMIEPLIENPDCVGSEPWEYTYRKEDGFITRYCALIGMNDPLVHFLENYDRRNLLTGKWTNVPHDEVDRGNYLVTTLDQRGLPTIGANGTVFKAAFLKERVKSDYLFDIDILAKEVKEKGFVKFIKVKNGIIHTYCERDILKFSRKQRRRVNDYLYHREKASREYKWEYKGFIGQNFLGQMKFILYCLTVFPLLYQSLKGYVKKPDLAWFFHPLACEITLWEYSTGTLRGFLFKKESDRKTWRQ